MITNKVIFILKRITPVTSAIKISVISVNAILVNIFLMVNTLVLLYFFWNNMATLFSFNSYFYSHLIFLISWTNTISFISIKFTSFPWKSGINTIYWRRLILHYSVIPHHLISQSGLSCKENSSGLFLTIEILSPPHLKMPL